MPITPCQRISFTTTHVPNHSTDSLAKCESRQNKFIITRDIYNYLNGSKNVGVTGVNDGKDTNTEELTTSSTELVVAALEVVDSDLGKHGVVLQLRLSEGRSVTSNDNKLGLTLTKRLQGGLVTKGVLAGLDSQSKTGVDVFLGLLDFRGLKGSSVSNDYNQLQQSM